MKRILSLLIMIAALVSPSALLAQYTGGPRDLGFAYANDYNKWLMRSANAVSAGAGAVTIVADDFKATPDGRIFYPIQVNDVLLIDAGSAVSESVAVTSASNCGAGALQNTCTFSATFSNAHGQNFTIQSGTFGVCEALQNLLVVNGGGTVAISTGFGGTTATLTGSTTAGQCGVGGVNLLDLRAGTFQYYGLQPSTLTSLAVPTTLTNSTVTFAGTSGTWTNAAQFVCVAYVDPLGGEGPCSATYNQTPSANTTMTVTSPAASTGAVGYRVYAGASYNGAFLLPITSSTCSLTLLESVVSACSIGSNAVFPAIFVNTTSLRPNGQTPTVNLATPMPQGHTTFAYQPVSGNPQVFQTHYGPFPQYGALTSGQVAYVGSFNLPAGFLNLIERTIRISGKLSLTTVNTATLPTLQVLVSWAGGTTAGVGVTTCSFEGVAAGATKTYEGEFVCTLTTNAVGATAIGTSMPGGNLTVQAQDLSANGLAYVDSNTAAVGSLGLFAQNTINIVYTSTTNATANEQLLDLHVEVLQ